MRVDIIFRAKEYEKSEKLEYFFPKTRNEMTALKEAFD